MTPREYGRLLRRRWPLVLIGWLLTAAVCVPVYRTPAVYYARATIQLLTPDLREERRLGERFPDALTAAETLAARVNKGRRPSFAANADVTLYGMGITDGTRAAVRRGGNQWVSWVAESSLDVQVVGDDPDVVRERLREETEDISRELASWQDQLRVPKKSRIQLELTNPALPVETIEPSRTRALGATALTGLLLSGALPVWSLRLRRRTPRDPG